jgi:hypothetical protein
VVLCMDLALMQEDYNDSIRGLEAGRVIRAKRRDWTLIAFTQFGRYVEPHSAFKEAFDGIIEKGDISNKNRPGRLAYIRSALESALRKHKHGKSDFVLPASVQVKDSLGMRTFRAAFGDSAFAELVIKEATDWEDLTISALTTGHSGAFMLSIGGNSGKGPKSVVVKVARDDQVIQDEISAQTKFLEQLGPLTGNLASLDNSKKYLSNNLGVYYRQSLVTGPTLLEVLCASDKTSKQRLNSLKPVVRLCIDVCQSVSLAKAGVVHPKNVFGLSPIDKGRFETSAEFLKELGTTLLGAAYWPKNFPEPSTIVEDVTGLANAWEERLSKFPNLPIAVQHGDLNPGNVILRSSGSPVLIDLSRLGHWPIGYDLSRLSLMLRLRLVDTQGCRDWLPDRIGTWLSEAVACLKQEHSSAEALCPESLYCDEQFDYFVQSTSKKQRELMVLAYHLGTLWDLLKIISYQDVSPYKRVWGMLEVWRMGSRLGLIASR